MRGQRRPELRIAGDRRVTDAVDSVETVTNTDGVQTPPFPGGEHPGADLQVQMPMRITCARGVVPHGDRLEHRDGDLDLLAARPHPRGGVLRQPADDLLGRAVLRRVVRGGDVRMQHRGQRPGLRPVHDDLDEPHRPVVRPQPAPRPAGRRIPAGHPRLVGVAGQRRQLPGTAIGASGVAAGDPRALGQVVVIRPASAGLQVAPRGRRRSCVDLHPAVQLPTPPNNDHECHPD
jgi:hypothetical protein